MKKVGQKEFKSSEDDKLHSIRDLYKKEKKQERNQNIKISCTPLKDYIVEALFGDDQEEKEWDNLWKNDKRLNCLQSLSKTGKVAERHGEGIKSLITRYEKFVERYETLKKEQEELIDELDNYYFVKTNECLYKLVEFLQFWTRIN